MTKEEMAKQIFSQIDGGEIDVVVVEPSNESAIERLKGQLDLVKEQNESLQKQLLTESRTGSLAGIDNKHASVTNLADKRFHEHLQAEKMKNLQEKCLDLTKKLELLEAGRKDDAKEVDKLELELEEIRSEEARQARLMATLSQGAEIMTKLAPGISKKIESGLSGIFGLPTDPEALSGAATEEQEIGRAILNDFSAEKSPVVLGILKFLKNHPDQMDIMEKTPVVAKYINK